MLLHHVLPVPSLHKPREFHEILWLPKAENKFSLYYLRCSNLKYLQYSYKLVIIAAPHDLLNLLTWQWHLIIIIIIIIIIMQLLKYAPRVFV